MKYTLICFCLLLGSCLVRRNGGLPYTEVVTEVKGRKFKTARDSTHWYVMVHRWTPKVGDTLYYNYPDSVQKAQYEKWQSERTAAKLARKH
jgi:hypothetical protein